MENGQKRNCSPLRAQIFEHLLVLSDMSWATLVEEGSSFNDDIQSSLKSFESEEAVLHGLRSSYNLAMSEVGGNPVGSTSWLQAMNSLENISTDCDSYMVRIPSATNQLQEISYLAKRNRAQGLSKDPHYEQSMCYPLVLEVVSMMMELEKDDISLVLLAARFAKQMNDMWTYKQLILFHQSSMPYLYKDLVLADFEASVNQNLADTGLAEAVVELAKAKDRAKQRVISATSQLDTKAIDEFVGFVAQKITLGPEFSKRSAWEGFDLNWLIRSDTVNGLGCTSFVGTAVDQENTAGPGSDGSGCDDGSHDEDVFLSTDEHATTSNKSDTAEEMCVEEEPGTAAVDNESAAAALTSAEPTDPLDAEGPGRSRRSGRATKKTDPSAWEEDKALRAALEASRAFSSRGPSQTQLSRATSGSEEASNVVDMKKLLMKAEGVARWSALLEDGGEGLRALYFAFPAPASALDAHFLHTHVQRRAASTAIVEGNVPAAAAASDSNGAATYCPLRVAGLFQAYLRLVNGSGCLSDLANLHVRFIQALASCSGASSRSADIFECLDCAVLLSWRALNKAHQVHPNELLGSLNAEEELLLLECALSVVLRCRAASGPSPFAPLRLHPEAEAADLLLRLVPAVLGRDPTLKLPGDPMSRFPDKTLQLRALWSAVTACRHFGMGDSSGIGGEATALCLLSALQLELAAHSSDFSVWLPHMHSERHQVICQAVCQDLASGIQYEAEVRDLVGRYVPTRAWVQGVLAQIRLGQRLQSLLAFHGTAGEATVAETPDALPRSIPLLLLEACRELGDALLWLELTDVVLAAAVSAGEGAISGVWMAGLLQSLLTNVPSAHMNGDDVCAVVASVMHTTAVVLYVNGVGGDLSEECQSVVASCVRMYELVSSKSTGDSAAARTPFVNAFTHVLVDLTMRFFSSGETSVLLSDLWSKFDSWTDSGVISLSSLPSPAWACLTRLTVDLWEALDQSISKGLRHAMLSILMHLIEISPVLNISCKGELYVHCHFEILDNSLHEATQGSDSTKRKRKRDTSRSLPAPSQPSRLPTLLRKALEELVFDEAFESNFVQRVQREITFVLGQVYFYCFGFPMVPLDGAPGDEEEEEKEKGSDSETGNRPQFDSRDVLLLHTLYKYSKVCIKGGWVNKAEIRASLLVLAKAEAFRSETAFSVISAIRNSFFAAPLSSLPSQLSDALLAELQALHAKTQGEGASAVHREDASSSGNLLRAVGSELFYTLLQLGMPPSEVNGTDHAAEGFADTSNTSLAATCDLGPFLKDSNQGAVVELCLLDLAYNPFRYSSWNLLLRQYMGAFNAVMDELQKLLLPCHVPRSCYKSLMSEYIDLVRPQVSGADAGCCLWAPHAVMPTASVIRLLKIASAGLETSSQCDLVTIFADSASSETFYNLNRAADPLDYEMHLQKVAHLISIRNATFAMYERISAFVSGAVRSGCVEVNQEGEDKSAMHWLAELEVLVLSNAAKCYPKDAVERLPLVASSLPPLQQDGCFDDDLYALAASAKLQWQLSKAASIPEVSRLAALTTCCRVAQALKNSKVYSKPVRLAALYQASSICLKAAMLLVQGLAAYTRSCTGSTDAVQMGGGAEQELVAVEECMIALLPARAAKVASMAAVSGIEGSGGGGADAAPEVVKPLGARVWDALLLSFAGLKECRRLDVFDFKSVYRIACAVENLTEILSRVDEDLTPPGMRSGLLELLGTKEISNESALEELAKLFDRKRSQIVAMWCVENAVSPWEKILVRISQFDPLRSKYIDRFLRLAVKCQHVEVVLDVLAFSFAALKHATAVVLHALASSVSALGTIVLQLLRADAAEDDASSATSVQPQREVRRKALRSDATRWLHVVFELFYQIRSFAAPRTLATLEEIAQELYPLSAVFVAKVSADQAMDTGEDTVPPAELLSHPPGLANQQSSCEAVMKENSPAYLPSAEVLSLCAAKWGRPKQPRSDLGKRAKGYFAGRSAAVAAAPAPTVEPAEKNEREVAFVGGGDDVDVDGDDDKGVEDVVGDSSIGDGGHNGGSGGAMPGNARNWQGAEQAVGSSGGVFLCVDEEAQPVHVAKMARTTWDT